MLRYPARYALCKTPKRNWTGFLCYLIATSVGLYLFDKYFVDKRKKSKTNLDTNKNLFFGVGTKLCGCHVQGILECSDLDCTYNPLSYMLGIIGQAQKSVDVCIYVFTAHLIAEAIIKAHKRGVHVRIIADSNSSFSDLSCVNYLRQLELPVRTKMSQYIMHHKFIIIDDYLLMNGSLNFTMGSVLGNWENVVVTSDAELVTRYVNEFQTLWDDFSVL